MDSIAYYTDAQAKKRWRVNADGWDICQADSRVDIAISNSDAALSSITV